MNYVYLIIQDVVASNLFSAFIWLMVGQYAWLLNNIFQVGLYFQKDPMGLD